MQGIVVLDKPCAISSAAAAAKVRRALGAKSAGHMGTLDPAASGVLLVALGKATRLFSYFLNNTKEYEAVFEFGKTTNTLDGAGEVTQECSFIPQRELIEAKTKLLLGKIEQIPPSFSAKHINGQRAYDLARRGEQVQLKAAQVEVMRFFVVEQLSETCFKLFIECSAGTYIRSLARDLAHLCQSLGYMAQLRRVRCGAFSLKDAATLEQVLQNNAKIISPLRALGQMPRLNVSSKNLKKLENGVAFFEEGAPNEDFAVLFEGELYGIGELDANGAVHLKTYLKEEK